MDVAWNLAYLLVLLAVGFGARRAGVLDDARRDRFTKFAFYVALPALVFSSTATVPLGAVLSPTLVVGFWVVLLSVAGLAFLVHRRRGTPATRAVAVVQSYHANLGFLGLPVVAATFGGVAAAKASLLLGVGALTQIPLTVFVLVFVAEADATLLREFRGFVTNPVLVALVAGLAVSAVGLGVPSPVATPLSWLSALALPAALLSVGGSLSVDSSAVDVPTVASVGLLKLVVAPALAFATFAALSADATTIQAGVSMLSMPTAVSTFVYANELGGDARLASTNVFVTTVLSVPTLFVVLRALG